MPSARRTPPPPDMLHYTSVADQLRTLPITGVIEPGEGGIGRGNDFTTDVLEIPKDEIPMLEIDSFCTEYHLQFCELLKDNGYYNVNSILEMDDEKELEKFLKVGDRAELRWAWKRMLSEKFPMIRIEILKGKHTPQIRGGHGGAGGDGLKKGGDGGTGEASQVPLRDVYRFGVIRGGIGGEGGAGGIIRDIAGNAPPADWYIENGTANLYGGEGGIGGFGLGDAKGKAGGIGEGPKVAGANVNFFASIAGGLGGRGGAAMNEGGHGGVGGGAKIASPLFLIDENTRRLVPHKPLEDFMDWAGLDPRMKLLLLKNLGERGFQTVGGLLEIHDTDLPQPPFLPGHIAGLKYALRKFVNACKTESNMQLV